MSTNALDVQVGGDHYKNVAMQPVQLAYMVGGSPAFKDVAKYLTRQKENREQDLQKALHYIQLENELLDYRASKYMVYMTGYEGEEIGVFCSQFDDGPIYESILTKMIDGYLQTAADELTQYINKDKLDDADFEEM